MLKIAKIIDIPPSHLGGVFSPESDLVNFSIVDGTLHSSLYDTVDSSWPEPTWYDNVLPSNISAVKYPTTFSCEIFMDLFFAMVVCDGKYMYVHYSPDYGGNYDPKTPYRLYYAHDTDKVYQNVMDEWIFVATKDHTNLLNAGNLTHEQIDDILDKLSAFKEVQW